MSRALAALAVAATALSLAGPAGADSTDAYNAGPIRWHLAAGYSEPTGQIANYLQGGWMLSGGFTYAPNGDPLGLRADVSFSTHGASNRFLDYGTAISGLQVNDGSGQFFSFAIGPSYRLPLGSRAGLYGFAEVGGYHSSLQLTQTAFFGGDFCDPYFGFCDFGVFPGDRLVYDDSRTRFGWNAGVGFDFPSRFGQNYFLEASYHRIGGSPPIEYVPIEFGIRF